MPKRDDTIEILRKKLEDIKEFPAAAHTIKLITKQATSKSDATITELTDTILNDFALTNKILRIVNTAQYVRAQYGGKINTISRAVYILGLDHIRNAALSLMLFENIENKSLARELRSVMMGSFLGSIIAREVSKAVGNRDVEESFLCSMFFDLGKTLSTYYMPDDAAKVAELVDRGGVAESSASLNVFGISYEKIGMLTGKDWHLSPQIVYCMQRLNEPVVVKPDTETDSIRTIVNFSSELCLAVSNASKGPDAWKKAIAKLLSKYKNCFSITEEQLMEILNKSYNELDTYGKDFNVNVSQIGLAKSLKDLLTNKNLIEEAPDVPETSAKQIDYTSKNGVQMLECNTNVFGRGESPELIFSRGIQEVASSLLEEYSLNDVLRMILEIMFRGLNPLRIIISIKSPKENVMEGRFGFGENVAVIINNFRFFFGDMYRDVFSESLLNTSDILINDVNDRRVKERIPGWYRNLLDSETFMLFPVKVNKVPLGLIYIDKPIAGDLVVDQNTLRYLKTLRDQTILAIKQKYK
ncbi:MAG: HDOD domain-containing protein [Nitrospirae bacterium]|nr:HDOD domain-containing protein [Nitrospirota bacterium]MBF0534123.1 HDOD domain-containing protein [Nitrospirota bacterium]MBF0617010.1 HDOD domain-containing protein [Nitrospirota bacterium]